MSSFRNMRGVLRAAQASLKILSVFFGAFGAYLLGAFSVIPRPFWGTISEDTVLFMTGSSALIATIGWASFKLSRPIILATYVFCIFLYCKFILGARSKYPRGLRHPKVARFQHHKYRRFLSSIDGQARALVAQLILTLAFMWTLFFSRAGSDVYALLSFLLFVTFFYAVATLAAAGVPKDISHRVFFVSGHGVGVLAAFSFLLFFSAGALRISDTMNRPPLSLINDDWTCLVTPLLPVSGGELVFLSESRSFAVIREDGNLLTLQQENSIVDQRPCWMSPKSIDS